MRRALNILVVEDNSDDVFLLEQAFRRAEARSRLISVPDGISALEYLTGQADYADRAIYPVPDLLLLDLNLPRKNGFEVLEWLRSEPRYARIMVHVLTSSSRGADIERAYALHANSYTVKPTRLDELVAFVRLLHQWHEFVQLPSVPREIPAAALAPPVV